MNKKQIATAIASTMFAMAAGSAGAGTATSTFQVQAKVEPACQILTTGVNFDKYDPASVAAKYASGSVTVTCVKDTASTVELNMGVSNNRSMKGADPLNASVLAYELFKPVGAASACTTAETDVWGSVADNKALTVAAAADNNPRTFGICGKLNASQNVTPDTYSDTITATVNF